MRIGIDLGTTTTTICPVGATSLTPLGPYPSVAAFSNEKWTYGEDAVELAAERGDDVWLLSNLKLSMTHGDVRVAGRALDPVEVLGGFLQAIFKSSRVRQVSEVVLGIPVRFSRDQRRAMVEAARCAGATSVQLVYEPTAALVGALEGYQLKTGDHVFVVDWGGGTLDIALVEVSGRSFRELVVSGDVNTLGGSRIDRQLANRLLSNDRQLSEEIAAQPSGETKFLALVERAKVHLLEEEGDESWDIEPPWLTRGTKLSRDLVLEVMRDFAAQAADRLLQVLNQSGVAQSAVSHVLFAGGVCQSDVVRDTIRKVLPRHCMEIESGTNPQLLTSLGCGRLAKEGFRLLTAADIVLRESDGQLCTLIPGGKAIEPDAYRTADLAVTGITDPLARLELGTRASSGNGAGVDMESGRFRRLGELSVPTGARLARPLSLAPDDLVRLHVGLTSEMCIHVHATSARADTPVEDWFTEVPVAVHFGHA